MRNEEDWDRTEAMPNLSRIHPDLELKVSKKARRMALRLDTKRRVMYLVVPSRTRSDTAYDFALQHRKWIEEHLSSLPEPVPLKHGAVIPLFGQKVTLRIYYDPDIRATDIILKNNNLFVFTNKEDPTGRIVRFLREQVQEKLESMAFRKAACIGKNIKSVAVRDTKSRWGSCNHLGHLAFSWRLIFAPIEAMDYVVAHEVAHLAHFDHSDRFWSMCSRLSKSYRRGRDWMDEFGHTLMRYGEAE